MHDEPRCPQCGNLLPSDAPQGLCPRCLVRAGLARDVEPELADPNPETQPTVKSPRGAADGITPLSLEDLAPLFPQLEIIELLGTGGMGAVYKCRHCGLDRLVALKILPPEIGIDPAFVERFAREAIALGRLNHPKIVSIYDYGQAHGVFYIVMEFVDGLNLRQTIEAGGLSPQQALAIVPQICEALQAAHDEGIVHRDIKPENILIDKRGRVKIADFGLAKVLGKDDRHENLTAAHQVMGTLRYMAPEQMLGSREVDHRADIYSLGVVFYELLTGELPIGRFSPPSKKAHIDVRLDEIVLRALEQAPELRYQRASDVKSDVETITVQPQCSPSSAAKLDQTRSETNRLHGNAYDPWEFLKGNDGRGQRIRLAVLCAVILMLIVAPFIKISPREFTLSISIGLLLMSLLTFGGVGVSIYEEWRIRQNSFLSKVTRTLLLLTFAYCFGCFFSTARSSSVTSTSLTVGNPYPWFEFTTGNLFGMNIILASWEWGIFATGWLSLYIFGKTQSEQNSTI